MRRIATLLVFAALLAVLGVSAQDYTMTFIAGSDVCTPMTVSVGGRSYTVHSSITIERVSGSVRATDCNGRKLKYDFSSRGNRGSSSHDTYTFHNAYDPDYDSPSSSSGSYNSGYNSNAYNSGAQAGQALGHAIFSLGGGTDGEAYPSLQTALGISYAYGEFVRLRYTGYGFHAYGSVGKDFLFDSEYKNKILWNVGLGSYFAFGGNGDPNMDISLGLSFGQNAQWEKVSMMIDVDYTYWIGRWRRVGIFGGGSLGWGSFVDVFNTDDYSSTGGFAWNLEAGFVIRLANF